MTTSTRTCDPSCATSSDHNLGNFAIFLAYERRAHAEAEAVFRDRHRRSAASPNNPGRPGDPPVSEQEQPPPLPPDVSLEPPSPVGPPVLAAIPVPIDGPPVGADPVVPIPVEVLDEPAVDATSVLATPVLPAPVLAAPLVAPAVVPSPEVPPPNDRHSPSVWQVSFSSLHVSSRRHGPPCSVGGGWSPSFGPKQALTGSQSPPLQSASISHTNASQNAEPQPYATPLPGGHSSGNGGTTSARAGAVKRASTGIRLQAICGRLVDIYTSSPLYPSRIRMDRRTLATLLGSRGGP